MRKVDVSLQYSINNCGIALCIEGENGNQLDIAVLDDGRLFVSGASNELPGEVCEKLQSFLDHIP